MQRKEAALTELGTPDLQHAIGQKVIELIGTLRVAGCFRLKKRCQDEHGGPTWEGRTFLWVRESGIIGAIWSLVTASLSQ